MSLQIKELRTTSRQLSVEVTAEMQQEALTTLLTTQLKKIFGPWGKRAEIKAEVEKALTAQGKFTPFSLSFDHNDTRVIEEHSRKPRKSKEQKNMETPAQEVKEKQKANKEAVTI